MTDTRYLECFECSVRDQIECDLTMDAAPGDGAPWLRWEALAITDYSEWRCKACGHSDGSRYAVSFVGYPGITEAEKEAQRHG